MSDDQELQSTPRTGGPIRGSRLFLLVLGITYVGACVANKLGTSLPIRSLPADATSVREFYWDDGWQDFTRCIRADVSPEGYLSFVQKMGLTEQWSEDREYFPSATWNVCNESWWDPIDDLAGSFIKADGNSYIEMAKHEDGVLYWFALEI